MTVERWASRPSCWVAGRGRPALLLLALDYGKLRGSDLRNVLLGEPGDPFKRSLQLRMILSHLRLVGFRGDSHLGADARQRLRKWLRDHQRIPGVQHPGIAERHVERRHRQRARTRQ